jgi:hypothetical protein
MDCPYLPKLRNLKGKRVVIHRHGTVDLEGEVKSVDESGCTISRDGSHPEYPQRIFVADRDIRGVSHEEYESLR